MNLSTRFLSWLLVVFAVLVVLVGRVNVAQAAYAFEVPRMELVVDVRPDASVQLTYEITFTNRGQTIDVVDIGLPHRRYSTSNMKAWVEGVAVSGHIAPSSYIDTGVEVSLRELSIPRGATATFRFEATMPDLVFDDTTDARLASFRITPTWFDSALVRGTTDLHLVVRLPEGVANDERVLHQGLAFADRSFVGGRTVVRWNWPATRIVDAHLAGVSFPIEVMERVVHITRWEMFLAWWAEAVVLRVILFFLVTIGASWAFLRFTGGTGWSLLVFVVPAFALSVNVPQVQLYAILGLVALSIFWVVRLKKARKSYLPPIIRAPGGGIKRGLTAPEAAIALELPLGQVLTMVTFGLLKKGLIEDHAPALLRFRTIDALRGIAPTERLKIAGQMGVVIHEYEHGFLDAFALESNQADALDKAVEALIEHTVARVIGYDIDQTRSYYRQVIGHAWTQAESIGNVQQRERIVDHRLEWMWLDARAATRWTNLETQHRWNYVAPWSRSSGRGVDLSSLAGSGGGSTSLQGVRFGDVAASYTGWAENTAKSLNDSLLPKGAVDLGGADRTFKAVLEGLGNSSGGGSGGGCACAGCACACACAGGGR